MIVIPAIDLRGGRCVRLVQGDFARETVFDDDPVAVAQRWVDAGSGWLHVVDLDGARHGGPQQIGVIRSIRDAVECEIQVGGGIRSVEHASELLDAGVRRVIIGTAALEHPEIVRELIELYGSERVVVGIDARGGKVATHGWEQTSDRSALDLAREMAANGVERIVYTDVERDGTLTSPNFEATAAMASSGLQVIASGGVARTGDLDQLAELPGVEAVIVGKALYEGTIQLEPHQWSEWRRQ